MLSFSTHIKEILALIITNQINKCDEPVTVTASMNVPDLRVTWSHTYTSDDIIEVPGFTVSLPSIFSAGVYVQVQLKDNGDRLHLKASTSRKATCDVVGPQLKDTV